MFSNPKSGFTVKFGFRISDFELHKSGFSNFSKFRFFPSLTDMRPSIQMLHQPETRSYREILTNKYTDMYDILIPRKIPQLEKLQIETEMRQL
jgi:hypothetical protein